MPPRPRDRTSYLGNIPPSPVSSAPRPSDVSIEPLEGTPPFFNVSFSTHRASPLHIGNEPLTTPRLNTLAQRFRNLLVGDVVRGVRVGLEGADATLARAGSLEYVSIRWFDVAALLGQDANDPDRTGDTSLSELRLIATRKKGLCIDVEYENVLYEALLLPTLDENDDTIPRGTGRLANGPFDGVHKLQAPGSIAVDSVVKSEEFLRLPLLLLRMPASLKTFVMDFLARTFDCRISPLQLGTRSLVTAWERWIANAGLPSSGPLAKDVALTLGFYVPEGGGEGGPADAAGEDAGATAAMTTTKLGIRSLDIIIPAADLARFVREGQTGPVGSRRERETYWQHDQRKRRKLAGGSSEEGWHWLDATGVRSKYPFTDALARYLDQHLALDLFHPGVQITKIACAGFALSESRIKIFSHAVGRGSDPGAPVAVHQLVSDLVERAVL